MIYNVRVHFDGYHDFEIEARDEETAEEIAVDRLEEDSGKVNCQVNDVVVLQSNDQYTQESIDDDRRKEVKE